MVSTARERVRERAGNLPVDVTSFVGRRREITLTKRLLAESRLVTLTGLGGVGKTRLALRVATNLRRNFRDKVWVVELEELRDPALLPDAVIDQLALGGPSTGDELETIVERLKHREMLLVLDNCEHVITAAAELVDTILRWCPGVRVLATSTQTLGIAGESTVVVPPLQVPDPENLPAPEAYEQYAAVRLFVDRAKAAVPEFELDEENGPAVMRLCHRLDGNPLAIELAAVRLRSLTPQQIETRLAERHELLTEGRRGAPARQQSLRALIDWSYELCSDQDKLAWQRVSMFSGSFNLEAAEYVAGEGLNRSDVLTATHSLVDKSILIREEEAGEVRFRLLHELREYGKEKLTSAGDYERIRQRHLRWYDRMISRFAREWIGEDQVAWVNTLNMEHPNIRTALHSALDHETTTALRMTRNMSIYWSIRGLNGEAQHWLELTLAQTPADSRLRGPALRWSAFVRLIQGEDASPAERIEQSAALARNYAGSAEQGFVIQTRGMAAFFRGDLVEAADLFENALSRFRDRVPSGELFSLLTLGLVRGLSGDYSSGIKHLERCIELSTDLGELFWRSYALWARAHLEVGRNDPDRAESLAKDGLRLQRRLGNRLATAVTMDTLAWIAEEQSKFDRSARLFGAAAAIWEALRAAPAFYAPFQAGHDAHEARTQRALGDQAYAAAFKSGNELSPGAAQDFALEIKKNVRTSQRDNVHQMPLTRREREIASLVAQGRTNKEIAESLVIAQRTVEGHVQHILTKLDFSSRAQIAGWIAGQRDERSGD